MVSLEFTLEGEPVPKGRPRFTNRGGYVQTYTPKKTADWEETIAEQANIVATGLRRHGVKVPFSGRILLSATFYVNRPKSSSRTREPHRLKKPDVDNLLKAVLDGLEDVLFEDDKTITDVSTSKRYADDRPSGVEVEITAWNS